MYMEERESEQTSPVLMVDATGHHKSPDLAEVPVVTGIVNSPVRVVCHSPRSVGRERSGLENPVVVQRSDNISDVTGHLEAGRRVKVAGVPSVNLLDSSARKKDLSPSLFNSDSHFREQPHVENILDHGSLADEARMQPQQTSRPGAEFKSFLGEEGLPGPPLSSNVSTPQIKQQLFDFSLDSHSQAAHGEQSILSTMSEEKQNSKLKKKKQKTARIVPSRYMDNKPKTTKKVTVKDVPLPSKKKVKASATPTPRSKDQSFVTHSNNSTLNLEDYTPFIRNTSQQTGIVTSTPADGMVGVEPPVHMGAPTPILSQGIATYTRPHVGSGGTAAIKKTSREKRKTQTGVSKKTIVKTTGSSQAGLLPDHVTAKPPVPNEAGHSGTSEEGDISQRQLELQYSRVVQAAFLYSRLKHSFGQKEKDAQSQIYSVWQEKEKLQREVASLELQLKLKTKIAELDKQIQLQMSGLKPIGSHMLKLILEYSKLAAALDTTRHHMSVNGVFIPQNHAELFAVLDESERLLGEIDGLTKQNQHKIGSFAKEMDGLSKTVESEIQEQNRCGELLAAASTLSTQERSLQAQSIMAGL
ncbi:uncharacterized protein LOC110067379 isoform X2 [Orbicella faveolata]|nr:uncharacterized protein LOC110067379 isoform X2 [Orbicella faveolata]XP_020630381.1 uncharacterized protein LOC110067379 isoform X2 [Orbicella faveolata]